jgi:hypothetical protein
MLKLISTKPNIAFQYRQKNITSFIDFDFKEPTKMAFFGFHRIQTLNAINEGESRTGKHCAFTHKFDSSIDVFNLVVSYQLFGFLDRTKDEFFENGVINDNSKICAFGQRIEHTLSRISDVLCPIERYCVLPNFLLFVSFW